MGAHEKIYRREAGQFIWPLSEVSQAKKQAD